MAGLITFIKKITDGLKEKISIPEYILISLLCVLSLIIGRYLAAVLLLISFFGFKALENYVKKQNKAYLKNKMGKAYANVLEGKTGFEKALEAVLRYYPYVIFAIFVISFVISIIAKFPLWRDAMETSIAIAVIFSPLCLTLSVPLTYFCGIQKALRSDIFIKDSQTINRLSRACAAIFDKSGTLTHKTCEIYPVNPEAISEKQLLEIASLALTRSTHPISALIKSTANFTVDKSVIGDIREIDGLGIIAKISDKLVSVGSEELMKRLNIAFTPTPQTNDTFIYVAVGTAYAGHIAICEDINNEAENALFRLKSAGVKSIAMFTDDDIGVAANVADSLYAIDAYYANLTQFNKCETLNALKEEYSAAESVLYVSSNARDSEIFDIADVSIGFNISSDIPVLQHTDVSIINRSLDSVPYAIKTADDTVLTLKENIIGFAIIKLLMLILCIFGITGIITTVVINLLLSAAITSNTLRLLIKK